MKIILSREQWQWMGLQTGWLKEAAKLEEGGPAHSELIAEGGRLIPYFVERMHGVGTPEDLRKYLVK